METTIQKGQVWEDKMQFTNKTKREQWIVVGVGKHQVQFTSIDGSERHQVAQWHFKNWYNPVGSIA